MYAEALAGHTLGCDGYGDYNPDDPSIVAVGWDLVDTFPCDAGMKICGPGGCILAIRQDTCPGCAGADVDLSRAGIEAVCGADEVECDVTISGP
jgi:hypothetical protein